jgi:hypothetical protein
MSLSENTLMDNKRRIYLLSLLLSLTFFSLIFYFRNTLADFTIPYAYVSIGIVLICWVSGRMETFILILLIITSTVFELQEFPTVPILIGDLYFSDILIILLLFARVLKKVTVPVTLIPRPMGYPILISMLVGLFSFLYSTTGFKVSSMSAGIELRTIIYLSLFFLVYYYIRNDRQLRSLILGIGTIACAVAVLLLAQYILGSGTSIVSGRVEILSTPEGKFSDVTRVLVPGSSLMLFALNTAMAIYTLIALLSLGIILTFTRIFWVMILVALVMIIFLARRRAIIYPRATMLLVCAVLVVGIVLQAKVLNPKVIRDAIFNRTASILKAPSNFQHDTLFIRYLESRYACWASVSVELIGRSFSEKTPTKAP